MRNIFIIVKQDSPVIKWLVAIQQYIKYIIFFSINYIAHGVYSQSLKRMWQ